MGCKDKIFTYNICQTKLLLKTIKLNSTFNLDVWSTWWFGQKTCCLLKSTLFTQLKKHAKSIPFHKTLLQQTTWSTWSAWLVWWFGGLVSLRDYFLKSMVFA
jgi:hypothetical protein